MALRDDVDPAASRRPDTTEAVPAAPTGAATSGPVIDLRGEEATIDLTEGGGSAAEALAPLGVEFIEQPLPAYAWKESEEVYRRSVLPIIADESCYAELRARLVGTGIETAAGTDALVEAASRRADWVMAAIVGAAGLKPTLAAVRQGTCTALANKECLVSAGPIFMREVARYETALLPVDSEHSAAMQAMVGSAAESIERICLTASGGPFRSWSLADMEEVTPKQALSPATRMSVPWRISVPPARALVSRRPKS